MIKLEDLRDLIHHLASYPYDSGLGCSYEEAEKYLEKTGFTVETYVALDYIGNDVDVQVPVVLLTEEEMNRLKKSLRKLTENVYSGSDLRKETRQYNLCLIKV